MFCPACAKEIPETSTYCLHCGKPVQGATPAPKTGASMGWIVAAALIVVLLGVLWSGYNKRSEPSQPASLVRPAAPVLRPVSEKMFSGQLIVRAGNYVYRKFTVSPTMRDVRVVGSFHASGGSGHDIQAVLAEESEFENWINGHQAQVLYSTGQITNGKIDVYITQPGTYFLAFNNKFSLVTDKDVFAEVELSYKTPD